MNNQTTASGVRHWLGFVGSGTLSFVVDGGVLKALTVSVGWPVLPSRVVSIGLAMVVGWLSHRTFTFAVKAPPTWREFIRFLGVAWSASALNYAVFAAILYIWPYLEPLIALFASGICAMIASYLGFRFAAFSTKADR